MSRTAKRARRNLLLTAAAAFGIFVQAPVLAQAQNCISDTSPTGQEGRVFPSAQCGFTVKAFIPERCAQSSCALVIDLPGVAVAGDVQNRNTNLSRLALEAGDVIAFQVTANGSILNLPAFDGTDLQDTVRLIMEAKTKLKVDPNRVHLEGFSQGAGVAKDVACARPDLIASISVLAPAGGGRCFETSMPIQGVMLTQSSQDQLVNPERTRTTARNIVTAMGLQQSAGVVVNRATGATITRFMNPQGKVLQFLEENFGGATVGNGHCFPGSFEGPQRNAKAGNGNAVASVVQLLGQLGVNGQNSNDIVATLQFGCNDDKQIRFGVESMKFFRDNPKR